MLANLHALRWALVAAGVGLAAVAARAQVIFVDNISGTFIDISATGTAIVLGDDDETTIVTTIGNPVLPAGLTVVANNGGLGFAPPSTELSPMNEPLPSLNAFDGGQALLPFWDDIGDTIGDIYFQEFPDRYIVQWNKPLNTGTGFITFQAQVFAPGASPLGRASVFAQMIYAEVEQSSQGGASATIGFQSATPSLSSVEWSVNMPFAVRDGTVLTLVPEPSSLVLLLALGVGAVARGRRG